MESTKRDINDLRREVEDRITDLKKENEALKEKISFLERIAREVYEHSAKRYKSRQVGDTNGGNQSQV